MPCWFWLHLVFGGGSLPPGSPKELDSTSFANSTSFPPGSPKELDSTSFANKFDMGQVGSYLAGYSRALESFTQVTKKVFIKLYLSLRI